MARSVYSGQGGWGEDWVVILIVTLPALGFTSWKYLPLGGLRPAAGGAKGWRTASDPPQYLKCSARSKMDLMDASLLP